MTASLEETDVETIAVPARACILGVVLGLSAAAHADDKPAERPVYGIDRPGIKLGSTGARTDAQANWLLPPESSLASGFGPQRSASFVFQAADNINFYGTRRQGFDVPSLNAYPARFSRETPGLDYWLRPRNYGEAEVGFKARLSRDVVASVAAFRSESEDEFGSRIGPAGQYTGRSRRDGLELAVGGRWSNGFGASLSYALARNYYTDSYCGSACAYLTRTGQHGRSAGTPEQVLFGELSWRHPRLGLVTALEAKYVGRLGADDIHSDRTASYFVANARLGLEQQAGRWRFQEFARVDNLLNRSYAVPAGLEGFRVFDPAAGRSYSIGISAGYSW